METWGNIATITFPIGFVIFVLVVLIITRRKKGQYSCPYCGGQLIKYNDIKQCPSCMTIFDDDKMP